VKDEGLRSIRIPYGNGKKMKRLIIILTIFCLTSAFSLVDDYDIAVPGVGLKSIILGKTTFKEVKSIFGETKTNKPTSKKSGAWRISYYSLDYQDTGLFVISKDKHQVVSEIEIRTPYKVKTELGVTMGTEKRKVLELYGKPNKDDGGTLEYNGIAFAFDNGIRCFGQPVIGSKEDLNRQVNAIQIFKKDE
jgi:hypothetical protein